MNTVPHILFDSAKQAGLLRYNYAQGDLYCSYTAHYQQHKDLYMHPTVLPRRKSKTKEAQEKSPDFYQLSVHMKKQKKVYAVEQTARQHQQRVARNDGRASKAVDEDLYKIPPEQYPKKKKVFGFFSSCLV